MRSKVLDGFQSGRVTFGRGLFREPAEEDSAWSEHPTHGLFEVHDSEAFVIDDRFFNQHGTIELPSGGRPILTTFDILRALRGQGKIAEVEHFEALTRLRRAGFFLVPIEYDELKIALLRAQVIDGALQETAELKAIREYPQSFLPGPLEGTVVPQQELPDEFIDQLRDLPEISGLRTSSIAGLVNSALVFRLNTEHSRIVGAALRRVRHQLVTGKSEGEPFAVLAGLATVAAVTRDKELAHDVRIISRVLRQRADIELKASDLMRVGLISSAANEDFDDWSQSVAEWFEEIARLKIKSDEAGILRMQLTKLCRIYPSLWKLCAKADAALAAVP